MRTVDAFRAIVPRRALVLTGRSRNLVPELMDDPGLDPVEHQRALAGLRRLNKLSFTAAYLSNAILGVASRRGLKEVRVLDLGCGSGDVAADVYRKVSTRLPCLMTGWDISETAIGIAKSRHSDKLQFETRNALSSFESEQKTFDVVYCSLFLHHFDESQSSIILNNMRTLARHAVIVDDLVRSTFGYWLVKAGCYLVSRSPVVHFDGPQSVRAAYTKAEFVKLAQQTEFAPFRLTRRWPQQFLFVWEAT